MPSNVIWKIIWTWRHSRRHAHSLTLCVHCQIIPGMFFLNGSASLLLFQTFSANLEGSKLLWTHPVRQLQLRKSLDLETLRIFYFYQSTHLSRALPRRRRCL